MTRGIEQRRAYPTDEMMFSIDFIRGKAHEAFLEMERALPYGCDILFCGVTIRADPIDYGDGIMVPGLKYYRLDVHILLPERNA